MDEKQRIEILKDAVEATVVSFGRMTVADLADELNATNSDVLDALTALFYETRVVRQTSEFYTSDDGVKHSVVLWQDFESYIKGGAR